MELDADLNAVVAVNVGRDGQVTRSHGAAPAGDRRGSDPDTSRAPRDRGRGGRLQADAEADD